MGDTLITLPPASNTKASAGGTAQPLVANHHALNANQHLAKVAAQYPSSATFYIKAPNCLTGNTAMNRKASQHHENSGRELQLNHDHSSRIAMIEKIASQTPPLSLCHELEGLLRYPTLGFRL